MQTVRGRNINEVYPDGLWRLKVESEVEDSRNGKVKVLVEPMTSTYGIPTERVLFAPRRNANPFFHLVEGLWMLAGSDDLHFLTHYNSRMGEFSDDGNVLGGAYGYRWRQHFERDQIENVVIMLTQDKTTRRAVIGMWDPTQDLMSNSKDIPCNTHIYFRVDAGGLNMTVCCRSNDAVWGAYGANVVHFSMLQEFIASAVGIPVGKLHQVSNNFHIYERHWELLDLPEVCEIPYPPVIPMFAHPSLAVDFLNDCDKLVWGEIGTFRTPFFEDVVQNAVRAWDCHKRRVPSAAVGHLDNMPHCDWQVAMKMWIERFYSGL